MVVFNAAASVPIAFVDADALARHAGDAVVGKQIRRVGPDAVDAVIGDVFHKRESVGVVKGGRAVVGLPRCLAVYEGFADCHFGLPVTPIFSSVCRAADADYGRFVWYHTTLANKITMMSMGISRRFWRDFALSDEKRPRNPRTPALIFSAISLAFIRRLFSMSEPINWRCGELD